MNMDELEPECSEECTCDKRQLWNNAKYVLSRYKEELKRLRALFEETNHHLDLMVGQFGIEALVEMVGEEE